MLKLNQHQNQLLSQQDQLYLRNYGEDSHSGVTTRNSTEQPLKDTLYQANLVAKDQDFTWNLAMTDQDY